MINQDRYVVALSHQLAHALILHHCYAASCGEMPSFDYIDNSTYLNSYHINDPNNECPGRQKPQEMQSAGYYDSVPYAWGMWDSVEQYNGFMNGDNNGYFAGDVNSTYESCSRGIDCSGLVSRAWGLGYHHGTCTLENISTPLSSTDYLQPGDIMNRCATTPRHAIIFDRFYLDGIKGYEATIYDHQDKVVYMYRSFTTIETYTPRRYDDVCNRFHLPLIEKKNRTSHKSWPLIIKTLSAPGSLPATKPLSVGWKYTVLLCCVTQTKILLNWWNDGKKSSIHSTCNTAPGSLPGNRLCTYRHPCD